MGHGRVRVFYFVERLIKIEGTKLRELTSAALGLVFWLALIGWVSISDGIPCYARLRAEISRHFGKVLPSTKARPVRSKLVYVYDVAPYGNVFVSEDQFANVIFRN